MTKRSETTAIDQSIDIKTRDSPVIIGGHFHIDVAGMTTTIDPVNFLSVERDPHRSPGAASQDGGAHFVGERVRFATEPSANESANDVDLVHGDIEDR